MLRAPLIGLVASGLAQALANQVPFLTAPIHGWQDEYPDILDGEGSHEWRLNALPNPNATDHLVFETVHSLLQHWPNTRMRNGHNIVPGVIPTGTIFYHGTSLSELPQGLEWVATSPEHSYTFCQDELFEGPHECRLFTLATTRAIKVVYFDGNGAALIPFGTLDAQDLIVQGQPPPPLGQDVIRDEWKRAHGLCDWGKDFDVDGFVRMGVSFEVIICDFPSVIRVVSSMNLTLPGPHGSGYSRSFVPFESVHAGSWENHFPGDIRVHLDLARLVSFYDIQLAPSLTAIRAGQERWDHRAGNISSEDFLALKSRLEKSLAGSLGRSSGIDWMALIHIIVVRFADRFELMRYLLRSPTTDPDEVIDVANKTQTQLRIMLNPYLYLSAVPTDPSNKTALDWTVPIYKLCATTHTSFMESELNLMTESEQLIFRAVRGVTRETCRVVTKMWATGVYAGIDEKLNKKESLDIAEIIELRNIWVRELNRLMAWLDWNVWVKCNPVCDPEEICYLPTLPISGKSASRPFPKDPRGPRGILNNFDPRSTTLEDLSEMARNIVKHEPDEWIRPQPKCVRRVYPYDW
ncbi:hypothetical protein JVU11DRAFT_4385 [Chiua virens]|nr:hypothetical protein JVU11DRAFT_4385 [Chiua virens]